jgi:hypothetical protein
MASTGVIINPMITDTTAWTGVEQANIDATAH